MKDNYLKMARDIKSQLQIADAKIFLKPSQYLRFVKIMAFKNGLMLDIFNDRDFVTVQEADKVCSHILREASKMNYPELQLFIWIRDYKNGIDILREYYKDLDVLEGYQNYKRK